MADISIAKLVAPFSIKVDKAALAKVDEVLKKYSNKKITQTVKVSTVVDKTQKKELAGAKALEASDSRRLKTEKQITAEKNKQAIADTKAQAAWMRNTRPRLVNGDTFEKRLSRQLQNSGLRQTRGGGVASGGRGGGTSGGQHALGLGRHSMGASYHGVMAGTGILTGFGLSALNRRLAEMQSAQVGLSTVAGSPEEYNKQRAFLKQLGSSIGATQSELVPEYTKFFANAQGTALEPFAQTGFASLTKYGKVLGLDQESMKGTFRAVSQMVNKQQIMAEELKGQLI